MQRTSTNWTIALYRVHQQKAYIPHLITYRSPIWEPPHVDSEAIAAFGVWARASELSS